MRYNIVLNNAKGHINMFEKIIEEIRKFNTVIIHRHRIPDGDAIGSQVGLKNVLKATFPDKNVYAVGDAAGTYSFMDDSVMDVVEDELYSDALAIILDTSAPHLISDERYKLAARTLRIDHHLFIEKIADEEVVDTSFESCCGLIAAFVKEQGLTLTPLAAKSLYTGMITDSGRFRYDSTTARTLSLASMLLEQDFDPTDIFLKLYADTYENKKLKSQFVLKIKFTEKNVAYIYTDLEEFKSYGVDTFTISRGMVNTMADIKGVDIWANFTESENGILCELRSSKYNINPVAVKYGGGGHKKASGATLKDKAQVEAMLADLDALMGE